MAKVLNHMAPSFSLGSIESKWVSRDKTKVRKETGVCPRVLLWVFSSRALWLLFGVKTGAFTVEVDEFIYMRVHQVLSCMHVSAATSVQHYLPVFVPIDTLHVGHNLVAVAGTRNTVVTIYVGLLLHRRLEEVLSLLLSALPTMTEHSLTVLSKQH